MSHHQQFVVAGQRREYLALPVGHRAGHGVFQRLGAGQRGVGNPGVTGIEARIAGIVLRKRRGGHVVAAAPDVHLLVTVFFGRIAFVQSLKHAVVLLVEPPGLRHRNPVPVHPVEHDVEGLHGPFQIGGIGAAEMKTLLAERLPGFDGLGDALLAQIHIGPPREPVFPVPDALAVAEQNDLFHNCPTAFSGSARTSFTSSRCSEKSLIFCNVVCAILSNASRVKNP